MCNEFSLQRKQAKSSEQIITLPTVPASRTDSRLTFALLFAYCTQSISYFVLLFHLPYIITFPSFFCSVSPLYSILINSVYNKYIHRHICTVYSLSFSQLHGAVSFLKQTTVTQLVKKFPAFHGTWSLITMFKTAPQWTLSSARWVQFTASHPTPLRTSFIILSHLLLYLTSFLFPSGKK